MFVRKFLLASIAGSLISLISFAEPSPIKHSGLECSIGFYGDENVYYNYVAQKIYDAYKAAGYPPKLISMKSSNTLNSLKNEKLDCAMARIKSYMDFNQLSDAYLAIPITIATIRLNLYSKKNFNKNINSVAYIKGQASAERVLVNYKRKFAVDDKKQLVQALMENKVDGIVAINIQILDAIDRDKSIKVIQNFESQDVYTFIHKRHIAKVPAIAKQLKKNFPKPINYKNYNLDEVDKTRYIKIRP